MRVAITKIGTIVSGDWRQPFVPGDTVIADEGKFVSDRDPWPH
jgi:enamidase